MKNNNVDTPENISSSMKIYIIKAILADEHVIRLQTKVFWSIFI